MFPLINSFDGSFSLNSPESSSFLKNVEPYEDLCHEAAIDPNKSYSLQDLIEKRYEQSCINEFQWIEDGFEYFEDQTLEAVKVANDTKNRWDIYPYDKNIVWVDGRYFNGSHIDIENSNMCYISTQAPLPQTFNDHWKMLWNVEANVTVMLTKTIENRNVKAHVYWPSEEEGACQFGPVNVKFKKCSEVFPGLLKREFVLENGDEVRNLVHYNYLNWPDFGVPNLEEFVSLLEEIEKHDLKGPLVVHCSAGVGRSGAFIATHSLRADIRQTLAVNEKVNVNIAERVCYLRSKRNEMVKTEDQYKLIFDSLNLYLTSFKKKNELLEVKFALDHIFKKSKAEGVRFYSTYGCSKVFTLKTIPDSVFKVSVGNFPSQIFNDHIEERFRNIQKANRVCKKKSLDLLVIPDSEIFYVNYGGYKICVLKQKKIHCNTDQSYQEELYLSNPKIVKQAILQLFTFIMETGYSDVCWRNNPIFENKKIAIIDFEEMVNPAWGIIKRPDTNNSLISCLNEKQGRMIFDQAKKLMPFFNQAMAEEVLIKRSEELKRVFEIQQYHKLREIDDGKEFLNVEFNSLGLDAKFLKPVQFIVSEINRQIAKSLKRWAK